MTLDQFIAAKPKNIRLGQHFVNTYWRKHNNNDSNGLFYMSNDALAKLTIIGLMQDWQWTTLPDAQ